MARAGLLKLLTDASMASVIETIFPGSAHAQRRGDGRIIVNLVHSKLRKPLDSQRSQPMVRQLPIRRLIHAAVFVLSVAPFVACENYEDAPERRLRASALSNTYFRTSDIDCQALNASSDLNYLVGLRPASQLSLSRSKLGTDIDALVLQIAHASFSRILLDPGGYASDLRAVASLIDDNSDEYATRVFIAAECFANTEPARYWLYRQLVWYVVNHDQMLARRQSIIADQVETDPQAFVDAARRRIVDRDPLRYSEDPNSYADDMRSIADQIDLDLADYRDFLQSFGDRVKVDDPLGASEYYDAVRELETPMSFSELILGVQRIYPHRIATDLRDAADRITTGTWHYDHFETRKNFDLLVAAHRSVHGSHVRLSRDWIVFLGFTGF